MEILKNVGRLATIIAIVSTGSTKVQGPLTMHEVQKSLGLDAMSSVACQDNINTPQDERASQACLDVWNICNGNPQKPVSQRVVGCFDRNTVVYDASGQIVSFTPELTGFTSSVINGVTVYTSINP